MAVLVYRTAEKKRKDFVSTIRRLFKPAYVYNADLLCEYYMVLLLRSKINILMQLFLVTNNRLTWKYTTIRAHTKLYLKI